MITPPNQTITGSHVGHSSQPLPSTVGPDTGASVSGRPTPAAPRVMPPNGPGMHKGLSGNPPAATDGNMGQGFVPDAPWSRSGAPNKTSGGKLGADDAGQYRRGR